MIPAEDGRFDETRRRHHRARVRNQIIIGAAIAAAGAALAYCSIAFTLGWALFVVGLVLAGLGLLVAACAPGRLRPARGIAAVVVAVLVVGLGISVVRLEPWGAQGWAVQEGERYLGSVGDVAVTVTDDGLLRGRDRGSGEPGWEVEGSTIRPGHDAVADGEELVLVPSGRSTSEQNAAVLDPATGDLGWDEQVGRARLARVTEDTLVFSAEGSAELFALDRVDGAQRWVVEGELARETNSRSTADVTTIVAQDYALVLAGDESPSGDTEYTAIDLRTGEPVSTIEFAGQWLMDHFIVDDVIVTVTSSGVVEAHSVHGSELWRMEVPVHNWDFFDGFEGQVRYVTGSQIALLDAQTGAGELSPLPEGFTPAQPHLNYPGSPWLVGIGPDGRTATTLYHSGTGQVLELQEEHRGLEILGISGQPYGNPDLVGQPEIVSLWVRVRDAVGTRYSGFAALGQDGPGPMFVSTGEPSLIDAVVQESERVVPLQTP